MEKERYDWPIAMATIHAVKYGERAVYGKNGATVISDLWLDVTYSAGGNILQGEIVQSSRGPFSLASKEALSVGREVVIRYNP
jgi:hypothetical protein